MFFRSRVLESTRCYSHGRCAFAWSQAEKQSTTKDNGAFLTLLSFNIFCFEHSHVHVSFLSCAFPLLLFEASLQAQPFLIRGKRETSLHYDLLSQTAFARNPVIQGNTGKHCLCHCYQGNKHQSPTATQIKLQFPPHTVKRRTLLKILMPEPNFLPAGRFYKAMKLPRSLKLLLCIMTCMPALVLQWFLHSCFFHIHTHKPRHKPRLPTEGGVHMHLPHIFLAWKVKLHVFYLIFVLTTSSLVEHASSNISTCSKRQLPYLETCENPSSLCEVKLRHTGNWKGSFSFLACE